MVSQLNHTDAKNAKKSKDLALFAAWCDILAALREPLDEPCRRATSIAWAVLHLKPCDYLAM
jgi:hypothetical protein